MSNNADNSATQAADQPTFSAAEMAKARECFAKAQDLVKKKNYDYAIEWYINGLEHWPEAVEEGHKPCRAAALFRGGKKVSFTDGMKHKTSGKDTKRAMLNAEMLLTKDPRNVGYMAALFKNAGKARFDETVLWIGDIFYDAASRESKPDAKWFILLREVYEEMGDRCETSNPPNAIKAYERAIDALTRLQALKPTDTKIGVELRRIAGKQTIVKGNYASADSFQDSIRDTDTQRELHDKDRLVQSDDRMESLIAQAWQRYEASPSDRAKITPLVDLLCRRERTDEETKAIGILVKAFKESNDYSFKFRADEIRMKQLKRQARKIFETGDAAAARTHVKEQLKFELKVYKERVKQYPTDLSFRYELGRRLFKVGLYDEAIPVLQQARNEPKSRFSCSLYIGRCFFEKKFYGQAADIFREAIAAYELPDDDLGKKLHYWLGRALEGNGTIEEALKIYGQLIQWDYNYRKGDVRERLERLRRQADNTD